MNEIVNLTDESFDRAVAKGKAVVDFWAPWCAPCRMQTPILENLAGNHAGDFQIFKVNVDDNQQTAMKYGIQSIPTIMIFKDGEVADKKIGVQTEESILQSLE
jgi:thioredoxin 1